MKIYGLDLAGERREFTLKTYRTLAVSTMLAQTMETAPKDDKGRGLALLKAIAESSETCQIFMRSALSGNHDGIEWLYDAPDTLVFEVVIDYMKSLADTKELMNLAN